MFKKILVSLSISLFFILLPPYTNAFGDTELPNLCSGGMYDMCSQAPLCGEYPVFNTEWEIKSRELFNGEIFEFCQYKLCEGFPSLCCYEMVRTNNPMKCSPLDQRYCLTTQCDLVTDSPDGCGAGGRYWNDSVCDIRNIQAVPLSQRFKNDILILLIDSVSPDNPFVRQVPIKYPSLWQDYQNWKNGTVSPTQPANQTPTPTTSPDTTVSPTTQVSPTSGPGTPTVSLTPSNTCVCDNNGTCNNKCDFDYYPVLNSWFNESGELLRREIYYGSPIKCSLSTEYFTSELEAQDKNTWCNRNKRTKGDADGDSDITSIDYFYYIRALNEGKIPVSVNPDFNGDGEINEKDKDVILQVLTDR